MIFTKHISNSQDQSVIFENMKRVNATVSKMITLAKETAKKETGDKNRQMQIITQIQTLMGSVQNLVQAAKTTNGYIDVSGIKNNVNDLVGTLLSNSTTTFVGEDDIVCDPILACEISKGKIQ
jgi:K+-sensing histidine kinase KdpD